MAMRSRLGSSASNSRSRSGSSSARRVGSGSRLRLSAAPVPGFYTPEARIEQVEGAMDEDDEEDEYVTDESDDTGIMM